MRTPEETITIPVRMLNSFGPWMLEEARSYAKHTEQRAKYEAEDRLRDGTAPLPERIKAAWARYGTRVDWKGYGWEIHIPMPLLTQPCGYMDEEPPNEDLKMSTFLFTREVTRNPGLTVTRVVCQGVTVEETYA